MKREQIAGSRRSRKSVTDSLGSSTSSDVKIYSTDKSLLKGERHEYVLRRQYHGRVRIPIANVQISGPYVRDQDAEGSSQWA